MRSILFIWIGSLAGAGLVFFTQIVLARNFIPAEYGAFAATLATVTLLVPLYGFGVQGFWLKVFGAEGRGALRWLPASFRFIQLTSGGVLLLFVAWIIWGPHEASIQQLYCLLLPVSYGYLFVGFVTVKLQLEERYSALTMWQLLPNLLRLLVVSLIVSVTVEPSIGVIATAYAFISVAIIVAGFFQLRNMLAGRFVLKGHSNENDTEIKNEGVSKKTSIIDVASEAWPFGLSGVFHLIYFQSDIILLKYLDGNEAAGIYNVAFTVMMAVYLLPTSIYQKFLLPKIHRWANHDHPRFLHVYRFGNGLMLLIGIGTAVAIMLLVPMAIPFLFGDNYQQSVGLLTILAFCVPLRFLASSVGATLLTQNHMRRKVVYMGITAVFNVLVNFMLIPSLGAMGAAIATVLSELLLLAFYLVAVRRYVFGQDAWRGWTLRYKLENV